MAEFGIILPQGIHSVSQRIPDSLEEGENGLADMMRQRIERLSANLKELSRQADECEARIQAWHREKRSQSASGRYPGIGPITAGALVASVGDATLPTAGNWAAEL